MAIRSSTSAMSSRCRESEGAIGDVCSDEGARTLRSVAVKFVAWVILAAVVFAPGRSGAEDIKIGTSRLLAYVTVPIMVDKGFLAAEGLNAELAVFDSAQPITVAVVSGDVDFGIGGLSAAFYNLAGQGQLRILAAGGREMPGFYNFAFLVANRAEAAGLRSLTDLPGHTVGVTQLGTALQYALGRVAEKYSLDLAVIRVSALQSNSNLISALTGGQLDAAVMPGAPAQPVIERGDIKRIAWVGDEVPGIQNNLAFTVTRTLTERPDLVARFLRAYRKAAQLYHDAVADENEKRRDGPNLPELVAILAKFANLSLADAKAALPWIDAEARLDLGDIRHQIAWYKSQGMIKGEVDADALIDKRFVVPLPEH
jgi:NitT/TauT family transport system substrate-binding protein